MRYLLLFLTLVLPVAADTTYYVDTDTGSGSACTVGSPCAHLQDAENLITGTLTQNYIIEVQGTVADTVVTFTGASVGAHTITVRGSSGATGRHAGVWDPNKYHITHSGASTITVTNETGLHFERILVENTGSFPGILMSSSSAGATVMIDGVIFKGGSYGVDASTNMVVTVRNSISYGHTSAEFVNGATTATLTLQNCIAGTGTGYGVRNATSGTLSATNTYAAKHSTFAAYIGTISLTTCASSDTTGTAGLQNIACDTSTGSGHAGFTNVSSGTEDFHIVALSALLDVGTDLSGTFTNDIDNVNARIVPWDIGAHELYVPAGGAVVKSRILE